jgi:hypothetical protein
VHRLEELGRRTLSTDPARQLASSVDVIVVSKYCVLEACLTMVGQVQVLDANRRRVLLLAASCQR